MARGSGASPTAVRPPGGGGEEEDTEEVPRPSARPSRPGPARVRPLVLGAAAIGAVADAAFSAPFLLAVLLVGAAGLGFTMPRLVRAPRTLAAGLLTLAIGLGALSTVPPRDPARDVEARAETFERVQLARAARLYTRFDDVELGTRERAWLVAIGERFGDDARAEEAARLLREARASRVRETVEEWHTSAGPALHTVFALTWRLGFDRAPRTGWLLALGLLVATGLVAHAARPAAWARRHLPWRILELGALLMLVGALVDTGFGRRGTVRLEPGQAATAAGDEAGAWTLGGALRLVSATADPARSLVVTARDRPKGVSDPVARSVPASGPGLELFPGPASVRIRGLSTGNARVRTTRAPGQGPPALQLHWDRDDGTAWSGWVLLGPAAEVVSPNGVKLWLASPADARPVDPALGTAWDRGPELGVRLVPAPSGHLAITTFRGSEPLGELLAPLGEALRLDEIGLTLTLDQVLPAGSDERHEAVPVEGELEADLAPALEVEIDAPERTRRVWLLVDDPLSAITLGALRVTARATTSDPSPSRGVGSPLGQGAASPAPAAGSAASASVHPSANAPAVSAGSEPGAGEISGETAASPGPYGCLSGPAFTKTHTKLAWNDGPALVASDDQPATVGGLTVAPTRSDPLTLRVGRAPGWPLVAAGLGILALGCLALVGSALAPSFLPRPLPRAVVLGPLPAAAVGAGLVLSGHLTPPEGVALAFGVWGTIVLFAGIAPRRRGDSRSADLAVGLLGLGLALGATWARTAGGHWWGMAPIELLGVGGWLLAVAARRAPRRLLGRAR